MWRDQSSAIREVNQKKIEEFIEEVAQMHLALVRLKENRTNYQRSRCLSVRSQIKTKLD